MGPDLQKHDYYMAEERESCSFLSSNRYAKTAAMEMEGTSVARFKVWLGLNQQGIWSPHTIHEPTHVC